MEKLKGYFNKYFSNGPKKVFVLALLVAAVLLVSLNMRKVIVVEIDGEKKVITTYRDKVSEALEDNGIALGTMDIIQPALDSELKDDALIVIKRAVNVSVLVDGKELKILTNKDNIGDLLNDQGITLEDQDRIEPATISPLEEGLEVVITRVDSEYIKTVVPIEYATEIKQDKSIEKGKTRVLQEGVLGEKEITTMVVYENGIEVSREVVEESTLKLPVTKVVSEGTGQVILASRGGVNVKVNENGVPYSTAVLTVTSTAYCPTDDGGGYTATGTRPVRVPEGWSTIAVDPRVIPLGTRVYVEGYGYAIAQDTGGAIKGNKIDVFLNSHSEAVKWGRRTVKVHILGRY